MSDNMFCFQCEQTAGCGGCDGARMGRNYYTEFVKQVPEDIIVLTLACGKYRFNDMDLAEILD